MVTPRTPPKFKRYKFAVFYKTALALKRIANEEGRPVNDILREAIAQYLERREE